MKNDNMKKDFINSVLATIVLTVILGVAYPLVVTALAQVLFHDKANGQLISRDGQFIGSKIVGQPFTGPKYFHSRPSAAGSGYDAGTSGGSNLGPTNASLVQRVNDATRGERAPVPIDLVTTSGSGLDPDITPAAAYFQVERIARERHLDELVLRKLVTDHIVGRQFGVLGEPRVNVLELNLALDGTSQP
jgi:K+-transporting ATPase ATPase C chain